MNKGLLVLLVLGWLCATVSACGSTRAADSGTSALAATSSSPQHMPKDAEGDNDNPNPKTTRYDADDASVLRLGHAANSNERRMITEVVREYYSAAADSGGVRACKLLYALRAETVAEEYDESSGSPQLHGKTCAAVLTKVFGVRHRELARDSATLRVETIRVGSQTANVFLGFAGSPNRLMTFHREGGLWKVEDLFEVPVP